jgi:hypothetical protein
MFICDSVWFIVIVEPHVIGRIRKIEKSDC